MAVTLRLPELSSSLRSDVPRTRAVDVRAWWAERPSMVLNEECLPLLEAWSRRVSDSVYCRGMKESLRGVRENSDDPQPLIQWLRRKVLERAPFTFNALQVERRGGRAYPYFIERYNGRVTISRDAFNRFDGAGERLLITNMTRELRRSLMLTHDMVPMEVDFRSCHAHIALALSGDETLRRDLQGDFHQVVGDALAPHVHGAAQRRVLGKHVNNSMFFGVTHHGLARIHREELGVDAPKGWARAVSSEWWRRYATLESFCERLRGHVERAQVTGQTLVLITPGGRRSQYSPDDVQGMVPGRSRHSRGHEAAWRSIFSGVFRAVEGELLSRTIARFHADRLRHRGAPVLPIYDGLLIGAPRGAEVRVWRGIEQAAFEAAGEVGVEGLILKRKERTTRAPLPGAERSEAERGPQCRLSKRECGS